MDWNLTNLDRPSEQPQPDDVFEAYARQLRPQHLERELSALVKTAMEITRRTVHLAQASAA